MSGFDNETVYANNWDFRGVQPVVAQATASGNLPIGTGGSPAILKGNITSPLATINVGYSSPNITIDVKSLQAVQNIGIAYSGGTFTVQGSDGTALSATNIAYVTLQSKSVPGRLVTIPVIANQTFTDGSAGTTDNARFGLTTGVNWAQDIPFFLYAVMDDTESLINFMISRNPSATVSPVNTSISKTGAIVNVSQSDFFSLGNITVTSYDSNPCLCIGSFRMQFVGATDSWTVSALSVTDGIGNFNDQTTFTMPTGVNGSASGTYFQNTTGTKPTFATNFVVYKINRQGQVWFSTDMNTVNNTPSGAGLLRPTTPYACSSTTGHDGVMGFFGVQSASTSNLILATLNGLDSFFSGLRFNGGVNDLTNAALAVNDSLTVTDVYQAF